jgi:hypothetical protein
LAAELELNVDDEEVEDAALRLITARMISNIRSISYLPIGPPAWLQIDGDELQGKPFRGGQDLPDVFYLENAKRCSCGSHDLGGDPIIHDLIVFSATTAIQKRIETSYCFACRYTKGRVGPDLGKYGLFNWNNKYAFSHELMNSYTAQFTSSITPFFAFHQTIVNNYLCEESPEPFVSLGVFCSAWFGFIRLQQLQTNMQCSRCGPNPPIVIADGVSISFPKHKVSGLRPPTWRDSSVALVRTRKQHTRQTCYLGPIRARHQFQKALEMRVGDGIEPLRQAMFEHSVSSSINYSLIKFRRHLLTLISTKRFITALKCTLTLSRRDTRPSSYEFPSFSVNCLRPKVSCNSSQSIQLSFSRDIRLVSLTANWLLTFPLLV